MRSHVTRRLPFLPAKIFWFQYRKRYEVTCDLEKHFPNNVGFFVSIPQAVWGHMWPAVICLEPIASKGFNTASGMRSHVTSTWRFSSTRGLSFQYRKRYEVTCDKSNRIHVKDSSKVSIPQAVWGHMWRNDEKPEVEDAVVSIPQAVWGHMWQAHLCCGSINGNVVSIPQAVWGHMWLKKYGLKDTDLSGFNTASGMRSHVTSHRQCYGNLYWVVSIPQAVWGHMWLPTKWFAKKQAERFQYRKRYEVTCDKI